MTKPNFTSINVVLDRSGSMTRLTAETITGFNKFLADQKQVDGEAVITLATFASDYSLVYNFVPVKDAKDLTIDTYRTAGYTALLDALGRTINETGNRLSAMPEEERPSKVLFVVITDGEENRSLEFKKQQIMKMIAHQTEKYSWQFVYLGCTQDQIKDAMDLGFTAKNSFVYSADAAGGTASVYSSVSSNTTSYRNSTSAQVNFFDQGNASPISGATTPVIPTTNK